MGEERSLAVVTAGMLELGVADDGDGVVVLEHTSGRWRGLSRHEMFWDAMRHLGQLIDERRDTLPMDDLASPIPVVVLPGETASAALFRGADGVRMADETSSDPGRLDFAQDSWPSFEAALNDLADEAEIVG